MISTSVLSLDSSGAAVLRALLTDEPDEQELALFAAGRLPETRARAVEAHIRNCAECAEAVADLGRHRPTQQPDRIAEMPPRQINRAAWWGVLPPPFCWQSPASRQVTARRGGTRILAPAPPAARVFFEILPAEAAARIERARAVATPSHLELAVLYAHEGMLAEAAGEASGTLNTLETHISPKHRTFGVL